MACLLQQLIGNNVRVARRRRDLSQEELALMLGMDRCHEGDIESGKAEVGANRLVGLCAALKVSADELTLGRPLLVEDWMRMTVKIVRG